jgi:hypothetical protein
MHGDLDSVVTTVTSLSIVLAVWGGILALGYALGSRLADRGLRGPGRLVMAGLAAIIGIALLAPNRAKAGNDLRPLDAAGARGLVDAGQELRSPVAGSDLRTQALLGLMLVHGDRADGEPPHGDPSGGRDWVVRSVAQGSEPIRYPPNAWSRSPAKRAAIR